MLDIFEETFKVFESKYGTAVALQFDKVARSAYGGKIPELEDVTESEQIKIINSFWRNILIKYPDTTELRSWLCEGNSVAIYINAFYNNWCEKIIQLGIVNE